MEDFHKTLELENMSIQDENIYNLLCECLEYIGRGTKATDETLERIADAPTYNHAILERRRWAQMVLKLRAAINKMKMSENCW